MGPAARRYARWAAAAAVLLPVAGGVVAVAVQGRPSPDDDGGPRHGQQHARADDSVPRSPGSPSSAPAVPDRSAGPSGTVPPGPGSGPCTAPAGPYQRLVEQFLDLRVDGRQSEADCRAIRAWQRREKLTPAIPGYADVKTRSHIRVVEARRDPNAAGRCPETRDRIACVDLPRQLMWVQRGPKVLLGPVPIRSGKDGRPTRTGWNRISWRNEKHVSTIYKTPMPYAQFFNGGQAFHGVRDDIYDPDGGSHGCVNLTRSDAERLWKTLRVGDRVFIWGRRAGT
ncbi:L,D-transpeptidase [Streptomyces sp. F63]|uniref:L,D-transpeptidase n=1 Tax=Streptomyces sp. F63 TaxID=2824887 RepID=UPI001B386C1E|nr:L,D-transpeptidase [Streptomyces sp. F63]MBQ0988041.1 L,D-transpeptidase [Streptomyces sp. F63]